MIISSEKVNRDKPQKLYVQLLDILKKRIEDGEWPVGFQIPIEEDLCKIYEVSKATVRLAVSDLVRQGYLKRQQGKGTFVCKRVIPEALTMLTSFEELMIEAKVSFSTEVLAQTIIMPVDDLDIKLNIPEDSRIIYIKRLRTVGGEPVLLQESYIPYHVCPLLLEDDVAKNSLIKLFEKKYGITITKVQDYIEIVYLKEQESKLLGLSENSIALLLSQHFYSGKTPIMFSRSINHPERFRFFVEFERK